MAAHQIYYLKSPPTSPGGTIHECHCLSSAWASQNHPLHVGQCTVAG
jgi:hypothetical protein